MTTRVKPDFTFQKAERLKSRKVIGRLFKEGQSFGVYPLRLVWVKMETCIDVPAYPVQFTVSVPKKSFKSAVARNRLRRQVRETWRLNKHRLYRKLGEDSGQYAFMVIYTAKEALPYEQIDNAMQTMIHRFTKKMKL
jgi:ribonuclease P protein component